MFTYRRVYTGPLQAVVLDWAGTTVDYGCFAPVAVFVEVFRRRGVDIAYAEARGPMGTYKRDHIAQLVHTPAIAGRWEAVHGRQPKETDVDAMFADAVPLQIEAIRRHADVIPGVVEAVAAFRARGLKIGSCTGYTREMMDVLVPLAEAQGYQPDALVCPDEVPAGRPAPWMVFVNAMRLGVYPMEAVVKIGDTEADITEGLNAGMWTIGLTLSGNAVGLSADDVAGLQPAERTVRVGRAADQLLRAGAHYTAETLADVPPLLDDIEARLSRGECP